MPTTKPRVQVTLEPSTHHVIERLAELQGLTRGAVIADLLDSIAPVMGRTVSLLEAAAAAPQQVKDGLRSVVEGVHDELVSVSGLATQQMDDFLDTLSGAAKGSDPHVVTRGSGMGSARGSATKKKPSKPLKSGVPASKANPKAE